MATIGIGMDRIWAAATRRRIPRLLASPFIDPAIWCLFSGIPGHCRGLIEGYRRMLFESPPLAECNNPLAIEFFA
jgi:hypothetical protein